MVTHGWSPSGCGEDRGTDHVICASRVAGCAAVPLPMLGLVTATLRVISADPLSFTTASSRRGRSMSHQLANRASRRCDVAPFQRGSPRLVSDLRVPAAPRGLHLWR